MVLARVVQLGLQLLAPRGGALGKTRQRVGQAFALALDVEYIAMARRVAPGSSLSRAQALPGIRNRIFWTEPLPGGIQQMHASSVSVAMLLRSQQIAVGRCGIDADQHGSRIVEDLIVQAHPNA
jgi:hypothetical protein